MTGLVTSKNNTQQLDEVQKVEVMRDNMDSSSDEEVKCDPVFGEVNEGGTDYRKLGWIRTSVLMTKTQVGIGALAIPRAFIPLGLIPGIIVLAVVALMTTFWSNRWIGKFKLRHPSVYSLEDACNIMFGKVGREVAMIAIQLFYIFVAGSALVSVSTAFNALSNHGACTAVFVAVAAVIAFITASVPTLSKISWVAWMGMICILVSIFTVTIAVAVQDRPDSAPQDGPWSSDWELVGHGSFSEIMASISTIVFAFTGTPYFFPIISEMKEPKKYFRAMYLCQAVVFTVYLVIGVVVYYYCGSYVASPALGSAGHVLKKVCYGIALPGLLVTTMIVSHIPAKGFFVRILRGSRHLTEHSAIHWATWIGCVAATVLCAYVIASAIPQFGGLVSLIGALLGTLISFQPYGAMWFYEEWRSKTRSKVWFFGCFCAALIIVFGTFCTVAGTYGAVDVLVTLFRTSSSPPWSCADNSGSS